MKLWGIFFLILGIGVGCKKNRMNLLSDRDIEVQVLKIEEASQIYRVRILLSEGSIKEKNVRQEDMWYKTDSCFYLNYKGRARSPVSIEPISNGLKNIYEYLVAFDEMTEIDGERMEFIYRDKFINKRTYKISLEND